MGRLHLLRQFRFPLSSNDRIRTDFSLDRPLSGRSRDTRNLLTIDDLSVLSTARATDLERTGSIDERRRSSSRTTKLLYSSSVEVRTVCKSQSPLLLPSFEWMAIRASRRFPNASLIVVLCPCTVCWLLDSVLSVSLRSSSRRTSEWEILGEM